MQIITHWTNTNLTWMFRCHAFRLIKQSDNLDNLIIQCKDSVEYLEALASADEMFKRGTILYFTSEPTMCMVTLRMYDGCLLHELTCKPQ